MTSRELLLYIRDYLNIFPDGNLAHSSRQDRWYPFEAESYSEKMVTSFFSQNKETILSKIDESRTKVSPLDGLSALERMEKRINAL